MTGNATHFDGLGTPYGGYGVPQAELDSQHFAALNVYNTPGDYTTYYPRPMGVLLGSKSAPDDGRNCGRWVPVTIDDFCSGLNEVRPATRAAFTGPPDVSSTASNTGRPGLPGSEYGLWLGMSRSARGMRR
ncbi:hypothetical protein AB0J72_53160 [Dactylosporangium sp. NPDC049742]|uniref:hypothetical protein n=1 Tax=Dactylosporangium sp. NPDC049742 TaxID=3154737 RepID=UPI00341B28EC